MRCNKKFSPLVNIQIGATCQKLDLMRILLTKALLSCYESVVLFFNPLIPTISKWDLNS